MLGAFGGHKRALGALEGELQVVTSYHVDTRNGTCGLCKNSQYSETLSHLSSQETGSLFVLFCSGIPPIHHAEEVCSRLSQSYKDSLDGHNAAGGSQCW